MPVVSETNRKYVYIVLEVCEFRFYQFPNCVCHVFPRIVKKLEQI